MIDTRRFAALALLVAALAGPAAAQIPGLSPSPTPAPETVGDPYRRETPRSSFLGFISAGQKENWALATEYLQFRGNPSKEAREKLAKEFTAVLDQHFTGDLEKLSRSPLGSLDDGLPQEYETAGQIQAADESVDVLLVRVTPSDGVPIWLVSTATLRDVPRLAAETGSPNLGDRLPGLLRGRVASLHVWQIAGLVVGFPLLVVFFWFFLRLTAPPFLTLLSRKFSAGAVGEASGRLRAPLSFLLATGAHQLLVPYLALPLFQRYRYHRTFQVFLVVGVAFLLTRLIGVFTGSIGQRLAAAGAQAPPTLSLARRLLTGAVAVFAGLAILALLRRQPDGDARRPRHRRHRAGLRRPEEPGKRFRRLPRPQRQDPPGRRHRPDREYDRRRRGRDALRDAPPDVRADARLHPERDAHDGADRESEPARPFLVQPHDRPEVRDDPRPAPGRAGEDSARGSRATPGSSPPSMRVRFVRFGASSLDVEIIAYVTAPDWASYLTIQEEFLLAIMEIVAASGTCVAFPSRTVYLGKDVPPGA